MTEALSIVCFLWGQWSRWDDEEYVRRLYRGVRRNLSLPHRFFCFTDRTDIAGADIEIIPLETKGWKWNLTKMQMFKPGMLPPGRVLAFDLDVVVTGSLDDIAQFQGQFAVCRSAYRPNKLGGSLIGFRAGDMVLAKKLYKPMTHPDCRRRLELETGGSERKYYRTLMPNAVHWQTLYPGQILSYKRDCRGKLELENGVRLIRFHGKPRPHEVCDSWVLEHWI